MRASRSTTGAASRCAAASSSTSSRTWRSSTSAPRAPTKACKCASKTSGADDLESQPPVFDSGDFTFKVLGQRGRINPLP